MDYTVKSGNPEKQRSACVVVGVFENRRLSSAAAQLDQACDGYLSQLVRRGDMDGRAGQALMLHRISELVCDRVLLVGLGRERDCDDRAYIKAIETTVEALRNSGAVEATCYLPEINVKGRNIFWRIRTATRTIETLRYRFDRLKTDKHPPARLNLRRMTFSVPSRRELADGEQAALEGAAIGRGMNFARDLGNLPGNYCTPRHLGEQAMDLAARHTRLEVELLDENAMDDLGMGALLAVSRGSQEEARLIVFRYRGADEDSAPYTLVGKGITFDTGGISLKPSAAMDEMKFDMCGAASVFGTMQTVAELGLPINVVGIVAAAENMPDGRAIKPGDIVTSMSGQTIEILNTDAEGRLALCDALTYAERFHPAAVVDIATLTGAAIVALGHHTHGLMGNNGGLVNELLGAGKSAGDRAWELPLGDEYQEQLKSNFADMANIGGQPAGTITAGCFLSRYARKYRWAHLDIAGTAWKSGEHKGATGRPVPLLSQWLIDRVKR
ncbi:leucyl aminopeptidase [Aquisalimonas sp.]|uniref:leucyl aminopeptidase n=1 Tax=unclassified Aquisalimonas TaxID=2644645 RepID=UPI0025BE698B|nr:leucyl aminopeptidase [Aquisalimonas sp.]